MEISIPIALMHVAAHFIVLLYLMQLDVDSAAKILGVITSLLFLLGFFIGIVYYFWRQKSYDALWKEKTDLEQSLKVCRDDKADALSKLAKKTEECTELRRLNRIMKEKRKLDRKLIHQLAGKNAGMELNDDHFEDEEDEFL